jgi:pimeloyl-ACP methyl ester carboxylesterase
MIAVKGRPGVFIVPGMCSNALEVKLTPTADYEVAYLDVAKIIEDGPKIFHELELRLRDGRLKNGTRVKAVTEMTPGVSVRPMPGVLGCAFLDPQKDFPLVPLWMPIIKTLHETCNLDSLAYDWRKWGDQAYSEVALSSFREQIESLRLESDAPVTILAHSMGAQVTLWCLGQLGKPWERRNVKELIFCAPAISGTPVMFPCFANGPVGNMAPGGLFKLPTEVLDDDLARITSTFACMVAEMPTNTGQITVWPRDQVFATTPFKKYSMNDVGTFLADVARSGQEKDTWQVAKGLWPGFQKMMASIPVPTLPTHIIYSKSESTLTQVRYKTEDLMQQPELESFDAGDGTITSASIEALANGWLKKSGNKSVQLHHPPDGARVSHSGCISCAFTLKLLPQLLGTTNGNGTAH